MADYGSDVKFRCPACGMAVATLVHVSSPSWGADKAIDRMVQEEVTIDCPACGEAFDADVTNCDNQIEMAFIEYPDVAISCGMGHDRAPDDDEWDLPASPETEFRYSVRDALELLTAHGTEFSVNSINRMVFVSCFAAFEAYLGDTLVKHVLGDVDALKRILRDEADLKAMKVDLLTVLTDEEIVFATVASHLKGIIWHNLGKADAIYRIATTFGIFPDPAVKTTLFASLPLRHDCVHRNGRDKDGHPRLALTAPYVEAVATAMLATVSHIEESFAAMAA